jgi:hypothetical protein
VTTALAPHPVNLRVPAGARFRHVFDAPYGDDGQLLNLNGWTGRGQVKPHPGSATVYWAIPSSALVCSGTTATLTVPPEVSRLWAWTVGVYQLEVVSPAGDVWRLARGHMVVDPWALGEITGYLYPSQNLYPSSSLYPRGTTA